MKTFKINETSFVVFFKNVKQSGNDKNTNIHGIQIIYSQNKLQTIVLQLRTMRIA